MCLGVLEKRTERDNWLPSRCYQIEIDAGRLLVSQPRRKGCKLLMPVPNRKGMLGCADKGLIPSWGWHIERDPR